MMSETVGEKTIDARELPPRNKHATIFGVWNQLPAGGAMLLLNDHDPRPLYYLETCQIKFRCYLKGASLFLFSFIENCKLKNGYWLLKRRQAFAWISSIKNNQFSIFNFQ
jgi:hypothetical protein